MSEYGVTPTGFVKKRLDVIIKEIQTELTEELGFDVSLNPESLLNVLITTYADRIAQLWEVAEQVYFSQYPSSAEGVNLDNAGQFGGLVRKQEERTKYTILCTGSDGTILPNGTRIASNTAPPVYFALYNDAEITRRSFSKAVVKVVSVTDETAYTITLNGNEYEVLSDSEDTAEKIVSKFAEVITEDRFSVFADGENLYIECNDLVRSNTMSLSGNLTTKRVSSLIIFQSEEYGKVVLPENSITGIVTTTVGFESCSNVGTPTYGRLMETDIEFRQSYMKKIASRSSMMLESITSSILDEVAGVYSATGYENDTNGTDSEGRPPHSIEIIVDGGDNAEIAAQILKKKAAGIYAYGAVAVDIPDSYGNTVTVRFNRPESVFVWIKVEIERNPKQSMPDNYADLVKAAITKAVASINAGESLITQDLYASIKEGCAGIGYIDMSVYSSASKNDTPDAYNDKNVYVTARQKVSVSEERIEVLLRDN